MIYQQAPPAPVYIQPAPQVIYAPAPTRPPTYVSPSYGYQSSSTGLATAAFTGMMVGAAMSGPHYGRRGGKFKYKYGRRGKWKR